MNKNPSLLEGLDIPDKGKSAPGRRDVATAAASRTVSRDWPPKQKKIAAIGLACGAVIALAFGGVAVARMRPLDLPKTFDEAKVAMETSKFKNMDQVRQEQYRTEADRLLREKMRTMTDEERRAFFRDESNRDAMGQIREQQMDEMAKKLARGEKVEFPFGGPGGFRGPGGGPPQAPAAPPANFQLRPGDEPPSAAPRTSNDRRPGPDGNNGPNQGGPNQGGPNQNGPNRNGASNPAPGQPTPGNAGGGNPNSGNPSRGNPGNNPGGGNSGPAAGGGNSGAGGAGGGGGGGRRGNPTRRIANRIQNGNAQSNGLRFEAMQKLMANAPRDQNPGLRIMFTSGSAELNELAFTTMAPIIKQLTDQPEISVRIWGLVDQRTDGAKLKRTALRDSFAIKLFGTGAKGEQLTSAQLEQQMTIAYNELLAQKAAADNKPAPALVGPNTENAAPPLATMEDALVADAPSPTEHLIALARQRQDAIKKYLVEKRELNPVRVRTVGVSTEFMDSFQPSAVMQIAR